MGFLYNAAMGAIPVETGLLAGKTNVEQRQYDRGQTAQVQAENQRRYQEGIDWRKHLDDLQQQNDLIPAEFLAAHHVPPGITRFSQLRPAMEQLLYEQEQTDTANRNKLFAGLAPPAQAPPAPTNPMLPMMPDSKAGVQIPPPMQLATGAPSPLPALGGGLAGVKAQPIINLPGLGAPGQAPPPPAQPLPAINLPGGLQNPAFAAPPAPQLLPTESRKDLPKPAPLVDLPLAQLGDEKQLTDDINEYDRQIHSLMPSASDPIVANMIHTLETQKQQKMSLLVGLHEKQNALKQKQAEAEQKAADNALGDYEITRQKLDVDGNPLPQFERVTVHITAKQAADWNARGVPTIEKTRENVNPGPKEQSTIVLNQAKAAAVKSKQKMDELLTPEKIKVDEATIKHLDVMGKAATSHATSDRIRANKYQPGGRSASGVNNSQIAVAKTLYTGAISAAKTAQTALTKVLNNPMATAEQVQAAQTTADNAMKDVSATRQQLQDIASGKGGGAGLSSTYNKEAAIRSIQVLHSKGYQDAALDSYLASKGWTPADIAQARADYAASGGT